MVGPVGLGSNFLGGLCVLGGETLGFGFVPAQLTALRQQRH